MRKNSRLKVGSRRYRVAKRLAEKQGWLCGICGRRLDLNCANLDHIIPKSLGGKGVKHGNLQVTHVRCNDKKGNAIVWGLLDLV